MLKNDSYSYYPDTDYYSSSGSLNLDVDKNIQYSGLDDLERPSTDSMYATVLLSKELFVCKINKFYYYILLTNIPPSK